LDTFSSRKKYQIIFATGKNKFYQITNLPNAWCYQAPIISFRSWPRGPSSFSVAKKNQNATAAPAAMKGSAKARTEIAAPVKAEER
jgi:hypothetical protein